MNKFTLLSMYILLISIFYFIPTNSINNIETINTNDNLSLYTVYLLDQDNYISRVNTYYDELNLTDLIKYKINILINGINNSIFYPLIPKGTSLNNVLVEKDNVYLDFSNELLNIPNSLTESMIESIIYSLSDINGINNIYIKVNNELLNEINNIKIEYPLTRNYGINKKYDITNLNNISKTTVVFYKNINDNEYYVPITIINNDTSDKINIIIEELKNTVNSQNNLNGLINNNLKVVNYEINDDIINLSFNEYIYNSNNEIDLKIRNVISYSIMENYELSVVNIN